MRAPFALTAPLGVLAGMASCTGPQVSATIGIEEPIRIESGQFISGPLPGLSSADAGAGVDPQVTDVTIANIAVAPGARGVNLSGHTTTDAQAVALRFSGLGTGYWIFPVGPPDSTDNGLLGWTINADFGLGIAPGFHDLLFSAIGGNGSSGTQYDLPLCVDTPVPDNLNACVPKRAPPAAVLSLSWDTPVNLNLIVTDPLGRTVGGFTTGVSAAGSSPPSSSSSPALGVVDRDSNASCVIDNIDRQDIVWQGPPPAGTYQVWVDLFAACHQPAVSFTASLWLPEGRPDGGPPQLVEQQPPVAEGELTAAQANGGAGPGLYAGSFVLR
jgi:hypothetical protein